RTIGEEAGESLRQIVGVLGQEMRRLLVVGRAQGAIKSVESQGERSFGLVLNRNWPGCHALLLGLAQDAFDPHRLVKQVGTSLAFETHKAVEIEDVARAAEVREVRKLERRDRHLVGDILDLFL